MIALTRSRQLILMSALFIPVIVAVGAVGHLVSLEASNFQPLNVPTLDTGAEPVSQPMLSEIPKTEQTAAERRNVALTQLQDGDWLMKQGNFKAAKASYQAVVDRSNVGSELKDQATARLEKLEKAIVVAQAQIKTKAARDQQKQDKLKQDKAKKATVKPPVKAIAQALTVSELQPEPNPDRPIAPKAQLINSTEIVPMNSPEGFEGSPIGSSSGSNPVSASADDLGGTAKRTKFNPAFNPALDPAIPFEPDASWPEADRATPRLVPNFDNE